jgi:signal transduction histidine kinase
MSSQDPSRSESVVGASYELRPPPQVLLWLTQEGKILTAETALAQGHCAAFSFRPGKTAHRALHPDCADANCQLLDALASGLKRIDDARILEWELPTSVLGAPFRLYMRRTRKESGAFATLAIIDLTAGRKITTDLRDANLSLSNLVEKSELERTRQIGRLDRKLRSLSGELILAQEKERRRIAADLHDSVGQWLSLAKLSLESARARVLDEAAAGEVGRAFEHVSTAIKEVRAIVSNLRPTILEEYGLVATLELLCQELQASIPALHVHFEVDDKHAALSVPQCVAMVRILQEALQNVAKHSQATRVDVTIRLHTGTATLNVKDNGRGFDAAAGKADGVGLASMRDRAQRSGGRMRIVSAPGAGTSINVSWLLEDDVDLAAQSGTYKAIRYGVSGDRGGVP